MVQFFEVGGCVRDSFMGRKSKDIDYAVEMTGSYNDLVTIVEANFGPVFRNKEGVPVGAEHNTCRAIDPKKGPVDFVKCRKDGPYSDNRHPDFVEDGDIFADLARRDFRMNAIARNVTTGEILDPYNGIADIQNGVIAFVGSAQDRIEEDSVRILRMLRFMIVLDFKVDLEGFEMLENPRTAELLATMPMERIVKEMVKMMQHDTKRTVEVIGNLSNEMRAAIFREDNLLKFQPTTAKKLKEPDS